MKQVPTYDLNQLQHYLSPCVYTKSNLRARRTSKHVLSKWKSVGVGMILSSDTFAVNWKLGRIKVLFPCFPRITMLNELHRHHYIKHYKH